MPIAHAFLIVLYLFEKQQVAVPVVAAHVKQVVAVVEVEVLVDEHAVAVVEVVVVVALL